MSRVIKQLFALDITYQSNSLLYYLQKFPLIGKYVPSSVYSMEWVKVIAGIISVLITIVMMFLKKTIYAIVVAVLGVFVYPLLGGKADPNGIFLLLFLGLTIAGGWGNSKILEPKKEQYYAIIYMRMSAKSVAIATFVKEIAMLAVGFLPAFIFIPNFDAFNLRTLVALYIIMVTSKVIGAAIKLKMYAKEPYANYLKMSKRGIIGSVVILVSWIPFIIINQVPSTTELMVAAIVFVVLSISAMIYIVRFPLYNSVYKQILSQWNNGAGKIDFNKQNTKEYSEKYITAGGDIDNSKKGYAFLAECFNKRHRRILFNTTRIYVITTLVLVGLAIGACIFEPEVGKMINPAILGAIQFLTFYMYFGNCGERIVKIYFMNCDNEMLTYRTYRQPEAILKMFTLRLKSIILMDWFQSAPIAIALPLLLFITGGTDKPAEYVVLFASIMAISTFFSVHNLVVYYTLQPFNKEVEMKNPVYTLVKTVTYLVCFLVLQIEVNPMGLGIGIIIFTVIYIMIALPIAYKVAPKTFYLK